MKPPIKTQGTKWHLREFILSHFPENYEQMTYVEPFCAGGVIFLNKLPSTTEVISDSDHGVIAVLKALRDEPKEFISRIKRTKYSERSFKIAFNKSQNDFEDYIDQAVNEYILRRMSRAGLKKSFTMSEELTDPDAWDTMADKLEEVSERIKDTTILCKNFVDILKSWDEEDTFFYLDPPALSSAEPIESYELTVEDHMNLIHLAKNARGKVMISGFSSPLYNRSFKTWKCKKKPITPAAKLKDKRVECVWINY